MADSDWAESVKDQDAAVLTRVLDTPAAEVVKVCIDFARHSAGFDFQESEPDLALEGQLPYSLRLSDVALALRETLVRRSGLQLSLAIDQLNSELDDEFLRTGGDR